MGRLRTKSDYESIRTARIFENQARLASLGLHKTLSDLRSLTASKTHLRKNNKVDYGSTPRRRSARLNPTIIITSQYQHHTNPLRCSNRLSFPSEEPISSPQKGEEKKRRTASRNAASLERIEWETNKVQLSPDVLGRRCASKSRGTVYHSVYGICCHFCRQKTLCAEEDCKRCGNLDMDQPCIGKTDCSVCHSSNGVMCRACLKIRYGEEMEEVRRNKEWMCPHCIKDKGINPYWICNSSLCLTKRKMSPTGIAIYKAREMGYQSVAHQLMDELQRAKCI